MEEFMDYLFGPDGHIVQRVRLICAVKKPASSELGN